MTTPEQIAKWVAEFDAWFIHQHTSAGIDRRLQQAHSWNGYLRRCQETEQAIKDARKQALEEVLKLAEDHRLDLDGSEYHRGWRNASIRFANLIKGLLK